MLASLSGISLCIRPLPYDFIDEVFAPENVRQNQPEVGVDAKVAMHIDTPSFRQQLFHQCEPLEHDVEIGIGSPAPHIAISDHFESGLFLVDGLSSVPDGYTHCEVRTDIKWWIDIDKIDFALKLL